MSCEGCRGRKSYYETDNPMEINKLMDNSGKEKGKRDAVAIVSFLKSGKKIYHVAYKLKSVTELLARKGITDTNVIWNK